MIRYAETVSVFNDEAHVFMIVLAQEDSRVVLSIDQIEQVVKWMRECVKEAEACQQTTKKVVQE